MEQPHSTSTLRGLDFKTAITHLGLLMIVLFMPTALFVSGVIVILYGSFCMSFLSQGVSIAASLKLFVFLVVSLELFKAVFS